MKLPQIPGKRGYSLSGRERRELNDVIEANGTATQPQAPRDVFFQPGSRGGLLTWKLPLKNSNIIGYRIYKGDEDTLYKAIQDRGRRQEYIELPAGTPTSTVFALFVSCLNSSGVESRKVWTDAAASPETGAPTIPSPPPEYASEGAGGIDRDYRSRGTN